MNNYIRVKTDKKYAVFTLNKDNITVDFKNGMETGKICLKLQHQIKQIVIPARIYDAYDLKEANAVQTEDRVIISPCTRKTKQRIQPLATQISTDVIPGYSVVSEKEKTVHYGKVGLSQEWEDRDVTVYMGMGKKKCLYIEDGAKKGIPSIQTLKAEYGASLYNYPYDSVAFTTHIVKKAAVITVPLIFLRTWNIENGDKVKYQVLSTDKQTVIRIAPPDRTDAFTGEKLDCCEENVDTVTVCPECHDDPDIKQLILLMKDTMKLCREIGDSTKGLAARVEALEKRQ